MRRWRAAAVRITGATLGSIIAAIMVAHAATNAIPSASVGVKTMSMPAISSVSIVHSTWAHATAVISSSTA